MPGSARSTRPPAFGAPYNVVFSGVDEGATLTSSVERRGILSLGTELGGWGRVNVEGVRIGERGAPQHAEAFRRDRGPARDGAARRLARHAPHDGAGRRAATASRRRPACSSRAMSRASTCAAGETAGFLHFVEDVDREPIEVRYGRSGVLWMSAGPGRVERGDAVAVVMEDYDAAAGSSTARRRLDGRSAQGRLTMKHMDSVSPPRRSPPAWLAGGDALAQQKGGDVVIAMVQAPPSLDAHVTSAQVARNVDPARLRDAVRPRRERQAGAGARRRRERSRRTARPTSSRSARA